MRTHTTLPKSLRPTRASLTGLGAALLTAVLATGHLVAGAPTSSPVEPAIAAPVAPPVVAGTTIVVAVPWNGSRAKSHVVCAGCALTLQAVASDGSGNPVSLSSGTWDPGDGSGPQVISVANSRALELVHTYPAAAAVGTPYTATIRVVDPTANVYTDTFKVQIQPDSLGTRVNMAIDSALWFNHKRLSLSTTGTHTLANTCDNDCQASTAATVQAFEVNGHRETGDPTLDPYVDDVGRGLRYLQNHLLRLSPLPLQNGNDPDANHNGYGLYPNTGSQVYVTGQVIDAFVASGTKAATATVGTEAGRAYQDIVQDMIDAYSFGMNDASGGWVYQWNDNGGVDSSSSGWWGVGAHAAESWGLTVPSWVTNLNATVGIPNLQGSSGQCGYRTAGQIVWNSGPWSDTGACLIMMSADGMARSTTRFTNGENYLASIFNNSLDHNDIYAMYNVTKAMRLAIDGSGNSTPITLMGGTIDWWGYDPHPATQGFDEGFARYLVQTQNSSGQLATFGSTGGVGGSLANSWGILILSPALFVNGPAAVCSTGADVVCEAGAAPGTGSCNTTGADPYAAVTFSASQSVQGDFPIASYSWNLGGGTQVPPLDATNVTDTATFSTTGTHDVIVTVTDTKGNSSQATCEVSVISSALAPVASAGGPYTMCLGSNSLVLDASASTGRGTNITNYDWDLQGNIDFNQIDATGIHPEVSAIFNTLGVGTWNIGLRITDDANPANHVTNFSTVTVNDCTPPVITVPANISVVAPTTTGTTVTYAAPSATDNVDGTDPVTCTSAPTTGLASGSTFPVGTTTITCTAKDKAGNNATPASFTIHVAAAAFVTGGSGTKVYGSPDPVLTPTSAGFLGADLSSGGIVLTETARDPGESVGSYATHATASGALIGNYSVTSNTGTLTITKATPVATATGGTFTYNGQAEPGTCAVTGVGSDVLVGSSSYSPGSGAPIAAGTYTLTCSFAGDANYAPASSTATITISQAVATCSVAGYAVTYDGSAHTATGSCTGVDGGALGGLDLSGTTHTAAGSTTDPWTFTDTTGNYSNASGTVADSIGKANPVCTITAYAVTYDTSAHTATGSCLGVTGETLASPDLSGTTHTAAGSTTDPWTFTDTTGNYNNASGTVTDSISKAASTTVVTCSDAVYTGSALTTCTAAVTGVGGLSAAVTPVTYTNNVNVGTAGASATYAGDANHGSSTGTATFAITPAPSVTVVNCPVSVVYNGAAQTNCAATVTGAGGLSAVVTPVTYTNNTNVGTAGASATYAGDANHSGSTGTATFAITPAPSVTVVSCPATVIYTGGPEMVCTAAVTGVGGLSASVTPVIYANNVNVGTAGASATYGGDANHTASTGTAAFSIIGVGGPTGAKAQLVADMKAYRATVSNSEDAKKLDHAIDEVVESMDPKLWIDSLHPKPTEAGEHVFDEEKEAVNILNGLIRDHDGDHGGSSLSATTLQGFINRIVADDRLLAQVALTDAAGGNAKKLAQAQEEFGDGDASVAAKKYADGIDHYKNAWEHAEDALNKR